MKRVLLPLLFAINLCFGAGFTSSSSKSSPSPAPAAPSRGFTSSSSTPKASPPTSPGFTSSSSKTAATASAAQPATTGTPSKGFTSTSNSTPAAKSGNSTISGISNNQKTAGNVSRTDYVNKFRAENAQKYKNEFAKEPTARPTYIPTSTSVEGRSVNITFVGGHYGYYNPYGSWIVYDPIAVIAATQYDHYVAATPVVYNSSSQTSGFGFALFIIFCLVGVVVLCAVLATRN